MLIAIIVQNIANLIFPCYNVTKRKEWKRWKIVRLDQIKELTEILKTEELHSQRQVQELLQSMGYDTASFYQELELTSRWVNTHRDVSQPADQVQLHSHTFYEILFVRSGTGVQYLVGTERYLLQRGDVILVRPGVAHRPLLSDALPEAYRRDVLWLSQDFVETASRLFANTLPDANMHTLLRTAGSEWEALLRERFRSGVLEEEAKEPGWEVMVMGNTLQLMALLYRAMADRGRLPRSAEKPELLEEVLAYVERHLGDRITLSDTAQRFYVSESKISRTFREKMGVSFYRCVTQRRLISAKNLIAEGFGLEQVSEQVGFQDYSTFYRAFRQEFGISPRQYRKLQKSDRGSEI